MSTFGKVTIERQGQTNAGTLTVERSGWSKLPWVAIVITIAQACAVGAAVMMYRGSTNALTFGIAASFAVMMTVMFSARSHLRDGVFHDLHRLEVLQRQPKARGGYRGAAQPAAWVIVLPHREVPFASVRAVVHSQHLVQPKDQSSYWVYRCYLVLADEVLDVASFREDEPTCMRLVEALTAWFDVKAKRIEKDPSAATAPMLVAVFSSLFCVQFPMMFLLGFNSAFAAAFPLPVRAAVVVVLPAFVAFALVPALMGLFRPGVANELRAAFRVDVPKPKPPMRRLAISALGVVAMLAGAGWGILRSSEQKAVAAEAEEEAIESWEWGMDALPWAVDPDEDGTWDYIGAFKSKKVNGHTVVALFDGSTHETRWRTPPMKMTSGHGHVAVVGDRVVLLQTGRPPVTVDVATGGDLQAFPDDPRWTSFSPSALCPLADEPAAYLRSSKELLRLDLAKTSVESLETKRGDPRCYPQVSPAHTARLVPRSGVSLNRQVGDYMLVLSTPPQILLKGKRVKQLNAFSDVQDGPICGTTEGGPQAWVPVAAGGGVRFDLEKGTFAPAPKPSWCEEAPVADDEPVLPPHRVDGIELDSHGLLVGDIVFVTGTQNERRWVLAFADKGRELAWKLELPGDAGRLLDMDADAERIAIATRHDRNRHVRVIDVPAQRLRFEHRWEGVAQLHGVAVTGAGIFVPWGRNLTILDRDEDRLRIAHGSR